MAVLMGCFTRTIKSGRKNKVTLLTGRVPLQSHLILNNLDSLHKWHLNLNNNTQYIGSLTFMFQDKGIFT